MKLSHVVTSVAGYLVAAETFQSSAASLPEHDGSLEPSAQRFNGEAAPQMMILTPNVGDLQAAEDDRAFHDFTNQGRLRENHFMKLGTEDRVKRHDVSHRKEDYLVHAKENEDNYERVPYDNHIYEHPTGGTDTAIFNSKHLGQQYILNVENSGNHGSSVFLKNAVPNGVINQNNAEPITKENTKQKERKTLGEGNKDDKGKADQEVDQEKADKEKADQEKAEKEKADKEKADKEKADKEKADKEKADQEKADKEKADQEKADKEKVDKEKADKEKADKEKADKEKADKEKADQEKADKEKADQEKADKEKAEEEKADQEKADKEKADKEKTDQEKAEKEKADEEKADQEKADQLKADKKKADQEKADKEKADKEKADKEKADKEKADQEKAGKEKADQEKADKEKAEKEKADQEKADKEKADQEKAEKEKADEEKADQEKADQEKADKEKADKEKADQEKADQEKADKEKADKEKADKEKADKEKADKEKADKEKAEKEKADKEKSVKEDGDGEGEGNSSNEGNGQGNRPGNGNGPSYNNGSGSYSGNGVKYGIGSRPKYGNVPNHWNGYSRGNPHFNVEPSHGNQPTGGIRFDGGNDYKGGRGDRYARNPTHHGDASYNSYHQPKYGRSGYSRTSSGRDIYGVKSDFGGHINHRSSHDNYGNVPSHSKTSQYVNIDDTRGNPSSGKYNTHGKKPWYSKNYRYGNSVDNTEDNEDGSYSHKPSHGNFRGDSTYENAGSQSDQGYDKYGRPSYRNPTHCPPVYEAYTSHYKADVSVPFPYTAFADPKDTTLKIPKLGDYHCFFTGAPWTTCGRKSLTTYFLDQCLVLYFTLSANVDGICGGEPPKPTPKPDVYNDYYYSSDYNRRETYAPSTRKPTPQPEAGYGATTAAPSPTPSSYEITPDYLKEKCLQSSYVSITTATVMCLTENYIRINFIEHYAANACNNPVEGPILYLKKLHSFIKDVIDCTGTQKDNYPNIYRTFNVEGKIAYNPNAPYSLDSDGKLTTQQYTSGEASGLAAFTIGDSFVCADSNDLVSFDGTHAFIYLNIPGTIHYSVATTDAYSKTTFNGDSNMYNTCKGSKVYKNLEDQNRVYRFCKTTQFTTDRTYRGLYDAVHNVERESSSLHRPQSIAEIAVRSAGILEQPILEGFGMMYYCAFHACRASNNGDLSKCYPDFKSDGEWTFPEGVDSAEIHDLSNDVNACIDQGYLDADDITKSEEVQKYNKLLSSRSYICLAENTIVELINKVYPTWLDPKEEEDAFFLVYGRRLADEKCHSEIKISNTETNSCPTDGEVYQALISALTALSSQCKDAEKSKTKYSHYGGYGRPQYGDPQFGTDAKYGLPAKTKNYYSNGDYSDKYDGRGERVFGDDGNGYAGYNVDSYSVKSHGNKHGNGQQQAKHLYQGRAASSV
ncbi:hypothetical protein AC1031_019724 [Aphanomyces cochlioides]|nr:hypothetical protein AC1031_019724 [Aphanomyces cochlioides]